MKKVKSSVYQGDNMVEFTYKNKLVDRAKDTTKTYFFFSKGKIHQNQGVVAGSYLVKAYKVTDKSGRLIERGSFRKGLKHGRWMYFDSSGKIIRVENWRNGSLVEKTDCKVNIKFNLFKGKKSEDATEG